MKIAAVSDDGSTISQHFGRAPYYVVLTVEDGMVVSKERRDKAGHRTAAGVQHQEACCSERHGFDAVAQSRHDVMVQPIVDCKVLLAGGMGWGAYDSIRRRGIKVVVTDIENIEDAVKLYLKGKLPNLMVRLH